MRLRIEACRIHQPLATISICTCTFRRPALLTRLRAGLDALVTDGLFTFPVVMVDNDRAESVRAAVEVPSRPECPDCLTKQY